MKERIQEGRDQRTFLRLPFAFLWICHFFFPSSLVHKSISSSLGILSTACLLFLLLTGLSRSFSFTVLLHVLLWCLPQWKWNWIYCEVTLVTLTLLICFYSRLNIVSLRQQLASFKKHAFLIHLSHNMTQSYFNHSKFNLM